MEWVGGSSAANGKMGPTHLMVPLLVPPALSYKCLKNIFTLHFLRANCEGGGVGCSVGWWVGRGWLANGSAKIHRQCCLPLRPDNYQVVVATNPSSPHSALPATKFMLPSHAHSGVAGVCVCAGVYRSQVNL